MNLEERIRKAISEQWTSPFPTVDGALTITRAVLEALREDVGGRTGSPNYLLVSKLDYVIKNMPTTLDEVRKLDIERLALEQSERRGR